MSFWFDIDQRDNTERKLNININIYIYMIIYIVIQYFNYFVKSSKSIVIEI